MLFAPSLVGMLSRKSPFNFANTCSHFRFQMPRVLQFPMTQERAERLAFKSIESLEQAIMEMSDGEFELFELAANGLIDIESLRDDSNPKD